MPRHALAGADVKNIDPVMRAAYLAHVGLIYSSRCSSPARDDFVCVVARRITITAAPWPLHEDVARCFGRRWTGQTDTHCTFLRSVADPAATI